MVWIISIVEVISGDNKESFYARSKLTQKTSGDDEYDGHSCCEVEAIDQRRS